MGIVFFMQLDMLITDTCVKQWARGNEGSLAGIPIFPNDPGD